MVHELLESRWTEHGEAGRKAMLDELGFSGRKIILYFCHEPRCAGMRQLILSIDEVVTAEPEALLLIIGRGKYTFRHMMKDIRHLRKAGRNISSGHVYFVPGVRKKELPSWCRLGDVMVLLSPDDRESIRGAIASCIPIVAPRVGGLKNWVENGTTGWLISPALLERNLALVLMELLQNQAAVRRMGELGGRRFG